MRTLTGWLLAVTVISAAATPAHFASLGFLVGSCWQGEFPGGRATDTHCYDWVFEKRHIRDVHAVRGAGSDYRGETVYSWDAQAGRVVYRYWNSDGGFSNGDIVPREDGALVSASERYVGEDGAVREYRTVILPVDAQHYRVRTEERVDGQWREAWTIGYEQIGPVGP